MEVLPLIDEAVRRSIAARQEIYDRWASVGEEIGAIGARSHHVEILLHCRIDLLLRQMEHEQRGMSPVQLNQLPEHAGSLALILSEDWVLRSYEIVRTARSLLKQANGSTPAKFEALWNRLTLVRVPIAKAEIAGAKSRTDLMTVGADDDGPQPYRRDGSYVVPRGFNPDTGSASWWVHDVKRSAQFIISRRELSDEFLTLFD